MSVKGKKREPFREEVIITVGCYDEQIRKMNQNMSSWIYKQGDCDLGGISES